MAAAVVSELEEVKAAEMPLSLPRALVLPTKAVAGVMFSGARLMPVAVHCRGGCRVYSACALAGHAGTDTPNPHPRAWQAEQPLQDFMALLRGNAGLRSGQVTCCAVASCHCQGMGSVLPGWSLQGLWSAHGAFPQPLSSPLVDS